MNTSVKSVRTLMRGSSSSSEPLKELGGPAGILGCSVTVDKYALKWSDMTFADTFHTRREDFCLFSCGFTHSPVYVYLLVPQPVLGSTHAYPQHHDSNQANTRPNYPIPLNKTPKSLSSPKTPLQITPQPILFLLFDIPKRDRHIVTCALIAST